MIKLFYASVVLVLMNCTSKAQVNREEIFKNNELNITIKKSLEKLNEKNVSDESFYILQNRDSLIILKAKPNEVNKPLLYIEKEGCFLLGQNKLVITKPFKPRYNIFKLKEKLEECNITIPYNSDFSDKAITGLIYKIIPSHKDYGLMKIFEGDISSIFNSKEKDKYRVMKNIYSEPEPKKGL